MKEFGGNKTKAVCFMGLGIALYVALSMVVRVPVFENYYLCLGYVAMCIYCYLFGPIYGAGIGGLGCILYCVLTSGLRGMPGWTLGNIVIGIMLGIEFKISKKAKNKIIRTLIDATSIIASTVLGILIVKSFTEVVLYSQPMYVRMTKNSYAFVSDVIVLLASLPICMIVEKVYKKNSIS